MTLGNSDCAYGYLADMSAALKKGMVLAMSNWGGDIKWLDGDTNC